MRHTDGFGKREALITIMNATYHELRAIEVAYGLCIGDTDYRPRIEYFHDAVRVLTQTPQAMYLPQTRLSVEHLAYDMRCLRYIQDRPLAKLAHDSTANKTHNPPAGVSLMPLTPNALQDPVGASRPVPPDIRGELAEHYRSYTVMYAALFAEAANINFKTRATENDTAVEDMARVEQMVSMLERGQCSVAEVEEVIQQLDNPKLRAELTAMLHTKAAKRSEKFATLHAMLQQQMNGVDMQTKAMDKAHMNFLSGQMLMYQQAKDLVRKLSAQGMVMAGQFLESSLLQGAGRGGQGR